MGATAPAALPLLQVIVALIAVVAVIFGLAWAARRLQRGGRGAPAVLRSHASLGLGPRERAVLVEAAGQFLLLGVAAGNIRLLHRYEAAPELPAPTTASSDEFLQRLREALGARK